MISDDYESSYSTSESDTESGDEQKIVLHVYDDESKEFTSLTTYHGMGGVLLQFYHSHPTTYKIDEFRLTPNVLPALSICPGSFRKHDELYYLIVEGYRDGNYKKFHYNSTRDLVEKYSYKCEEMVQVITLGNASVTNFCKLSERVITDIGVCYTFKDWSDTPSMHISIKLNPHFKKEFTVHLHDKFTKPSKLSSQYWVKTSTSSIINFKAVEKHLLPMGRGGTCHVQNDDFLYDYTECMTNCTAYSTASQNGCDPFYIDSINYCTIAELLNYFRNVPSQKCNCQVQCYSQNYDLAPLISIPNHKNETTLKIQTKSAFVKTYHQYKRFKQVDLMSYVGGVMGLFLGMSCITLLEVFIYLFKTVFGTLNDTRHQKFVSGLLGETESDLRASHEEIIITQKINSKIKEERTVINEEIVIEEFEDAVPGRRKMSQWAVPGDKNLGLKLQLYRPNVALRRNSTYLGACDF